MNHTINSTNRSIDRSSNVARNTYDLKNGFLHAQVQFAHAHVQVLNSEFFAVDEKGDVLLAEQQCQRPDCRGLVQRIYLKVPRVHLGARVDVDGHALILAVQEEGQLVLCRGEVHHEKCLQRDLQLPARPLRKECDRIRESPLRYRTDSP